MYVANLERVINQEGLRHLYALVEQVCRCEAQYIRMCWQDHERASLWEKEADKVSKLSSKVQV